MNSEHVETATAAATAASNVFEKASYTGSLAMLGGWLVSSNAAALLGLLVGVAGVIGQFLRWYADRRDHATRLREIEIRERELQLQERDIELRESQHANQHPHKDAPT